MRKHSKYLWRPAATKAQRRTAAVVASIAPFHLALNPGFAMGQALRFTLRVTSDRQ